MINKLSAYEMEDLRNNVWQYLTHGNKTIYVLTRSVSKSGLSRKVSVYVVNNGELLNLTYFVGSLLGLPLQDKNGYWTVTLNGGGMDMHFKLAYDLGMVLFGDGYALRKETI